MKHLILIILCGVLSMGQVGSRDFNSSDNMDGGDIDDMDFSGDYSICAVVKTDNIATTFQWLLTKNDGSNGIETYWRGDGNGMVSIFEITGSRKANSSSEYTAESDEWFFWCTCYDDGTDIMTNYWRDVQDGGVLQVDEQTGLQFGPGANSEDVQLGEIYNAGGSNWNGHMAYVSVFNVMLTQQEVERMSFCFGSVRRGILHEWYTQGTVDPERDRVATSNLTNGSTTATGDGPPLTYCGGSS